MTTTTTRTRPVIRVTPPGVPAKAPVTTEEDLLARWLPSEQQLAQAYALLATTTSADATVTVPLAQPGKEQGWWEVGQKVEHPAGVFLATTDEEYRVAREASATVAAAHMRGRPGTVARAVIRRSGTPAIFEDCLDPATILRTAGMP